MRWEEALTAAPHNADPAKLAASALTYHYLNGGPALLREREQALRRVVSALPDGARLPVELRRDLAAWVAATAPGAGGRVWSRRSSGIR